jgi:hypothetical protein
MPEDVEAKARVLLEKGCHFDVEILTTGMISLTCEKDDDLISIAVCENGPAVIDSVRAIIESATKKLDA